MEIELHSSFKKSYKKRIKHNPKLVTKVRKRIKLFQEDPKSPSLDDHQLKGEKCNQRAFSITGNIRIVYKPLGEKTILFLDVGSHNQVY